MPARLALTAVAVLVAPRPANAQIPTAEYAARRTAVAQRMQDGVLLALGAREPRHDYESFFQSSSFTYLTGYREPNAALVMVKRQGRVVATLFVEPKDPVREVWSGKRFGPDGATAVTGIDARPRQELEPVLDSLLGTATRLYVVGDVRPDPRGEAPGDPATPDEQYVRALSASRRSLAVASLNGVVAELRGKKSAAELDLIRKAVDITVQAHREAMRAIEPGMNEFEIQALVEYTFRRNGADRSSFASIIASGPNATTLHYNADDRFMNAGEVVVMDIGASYRGYAADVTRTVPVSGTFTAEQRAIYQIVRDAQAAAERQARVGNAPRLMSDSASAVLAAGLARLGLIESPTARFDCGSAQQQRQCDQLGLYYMHGVGHGIGLDVHDPDRSGSIGKLAAGSAFTLEPGIYVRENLLDLLPRTPRNEALIAKLRPLIERYRNIGVRIEDDYVVTERGVEWISRLPREIDEIEALMREAYAGPARRDAEKVGWYRTPK